MVVRVLVIVTMTVMVSAIPVAKCDTHLSSASQAELLNDQEQKEHKQHDEKIDRYFTDAENFR